MSDNQYLSVPQGNNQPDNDQAPAYNPQAIPFPVNNNYQEFLNRTNGLLSIQILDSIHNLLTLVPTLHSENLNLAGEVVVWLQRRHQGKLCPNFDEISDQNTTSKCLVCFGTEYEGGYYDPVILKMSFIPGRADIMIEEAGLTVTQSPRAWTQVTTPCIEEQDIVVTYRNERYVVHSSEQIEKQGRRVYQDLTLSRIDKNDVAYFIPVPGGGGEGTPLSVPCSIIIRQPHATFRANITIKNYIFDDINNDANSNVELN